MMRKVETGEAMTPDGEEINGAMILRMLSVRAVNTMSGGATFIVGDATTRTGGVKMESVNMFRTRAASTMSGVVINTVRDEMTNGGFKV